MALTPKIVATNTPLAVVVLVTALFGSIWAIVEFAPGRAFLSADDLAVTMAAPAPQPSTAPRTHPEVAFSPDVRPESPALCTWLAAQTIKHFEPLADGVDVVAHSAEIADLVTVYLDVNCPAAIHEGDWHVTAQILGVGMIHDVVRPQAAIYDDSIEWDPRAAHLVPVATSTFNVLAPLTMCEEALHQRFLPEGHTNAMTPLVERCVERFAQH